MKTLLKRFDTPDEIRQFEKGRFELVHLEGVTIGRATYEPGWRWSHHVGPVSGADLCRVEHFGLVVAGHAMVEFEDGSQVHLEAGTLFHIPPVPHDSWVVGQERYVSLHLGGAHQYAR